jgi:uncharacterized repeat protein (TIGR03803 family)
LVYGIFLLFLATAIASAAQTFTTLHSFDGKHGATPYAGLVEATDGNFYGTTVEGGNNGGGTVFKVTPGGKLTTLHSFCSQRNCRDGASPYAGLLQATDGNFYGTTYKGGTSGYGTVFSISPSGKLTTLHSFCSQRNCVDGANPYAKLVQATNGNFYGTTVQGGGKGDGTVFEITSKGRLTILHSFCSQRNCADGGNPWAKLIQAANGTLYGTTFGFGSNSCGGNQSAGTVFKISLSGKLTTIHYFVYMDGGCPETGLVQAANGMFYGTTESGGQGQWDEGFGVVFRITLGGKWTKLHSFCSSDCTDGSYPSELIQAANTNLYGTTLGGGHIGSPGTIFKITPSGKLTTLHNFCSQPNCEDGDKAGAALLQATDGNLYGTTSKGGAHGFGTIFRLAVQKQATVLENYPFLTPYVEIKKSSYGTSARDF